MYRLHRKMSEEWREVIHWSSDLMTTSATTVERGLPMGEPLVCLKNWVSNVKVDMPRHMEVSSTTVSATGRLWEVMIRPGNPQNFSSLEETKRYRLNFMQDGGFVLAMPYSLGYNGATLGNRSDTVVSTFLAWLERGYSRREVLTIPLINQTRGKSRYTFPVPKREKYLNDPLFESTLTPDLEEFILRQAEENAAQPGYTSPIVTTQDFNPGEWKEGVCALGHLIRLMAINLGSSLQFVYVYLYAVVGCCSFLDSYCTYKVLRLIPVPFLGYNDFHDCFNLVLLGLVLVSLEIFTCLLKYINCQLSTLMLAGIVPTLQLDICKIADSIPTACWFLTTKPQDPNLH
ncbi:hypothetical protein LAZ67_19002234 [Cordylochernes scorpioides]|uniref:Uncharacterized protein n=1 Tax=Cordylochernes scorpioides TaxID=51811 RepID=A0ABY6LL88_9ARAC|nr:hypothetical protein LAZ67_19002234 [Cordylochernes scorpioides]